ncbi:MAG: cyclic peptide export ABC transporter [Bacteroidales bacterium]|nr:cyclic peptide export ABC transporter [Bacteroidales bacterium]
MKAKFFLFGLMIIIYTQISSISLFAQSDTAQNPYGIVWSEIKTVFNKADIHGLSVIIVDEKKTYIQNFGYADIENKISVTSKTLFELGSTSKAFTALAILHLKEEGLLGLDDYVSKYIPWFKTYFKGKEVKITIDQLLHHTSGIPTESISKIPKGVGAKMLQKTVELINNCELNNYPGVEYEYATINYDILGLIIEKISDLTFEEYLQINIFQPLDLNSTSVGKPVNSNFSKGYKISFFSPLEYRAPRFDGNNPAGYIISNGEDMAKWLKHQLFLDTNCYEEIIKKSHLPDFTVKPRGLSSYAFGWHVNPYGEPKIYHEGLNPNFSSFIGFLPHKKIGIVILANSNSDYTPYLGEIIMKIFNNEDISEISEPENSVDKMCSLVSIILIVLIVGIFILLVWIIKGIIKGERRIKMLNSREILILLGGLLLTLPFLYGVYLLPKAMTNFSWEIAIVWAPKSFLFGCILFVCTVVGAWLLSALSTLIPTKNQYYSSLPMILILSIMSGLANMCIILILLNAIGNETNIGFLLYYFALALVFYISSRKIVQTKLINISLSIVYELRMKLINKIFLSSFQKFEKIDNGRIYATLTQDTATISNSVNIIISLLSNAITIIGVFIYLGTISLTAMFSILSVILCVATLYFIISKRTNILFEQARDSANVFSRLINGLLYGFKELSLSGLKKKEYTFEVEGCCSELRDKSSFALIKFVNVFLVGETLLIMVLCTVSFVIPFLFPEIPNYKLFGIIMIILYLIGPINAILNTIPSIVQINVSWNRIKDFIEEIKPDLKLTDILKSKNHGIHVKSLSVQGLMFEYEKGQEDDSFKVGPINLNINGGEILFIIGGNGSGKSTLANLLTGLYIANEGYIEINGNKINNRELGEYYSTIFSNDHIFKTLYGIDTDSRKDELADLLKLLRLEEKVSVVNGTFSTIDLSNGQRKRLSLMKCFLENSQIYLFDEWAADQDPEFKKIFYRKLLPEMRKSGKIVIAITHDDNYFDVADRIIKMDMGKMVEYKEKESISGAIV